jgi:uncharacterized protein YukE
MNEEIETTLRALASRHINGFFAKNCSVARERILKLIPEKAVVGIGDSTTVRQIGIIEELKKRGTKVFDGFDRKLFDMYKNNWEKIHEEMEIKSTVCDVFLTGTNAVTQDGRLVNVDAQGNRVAGMFHGHPSSIIVVGRNKIVRTLDDAFYRIRKIVAPNHIRIRSVELHGRKVKTPCVVDGKCVDCRAKDRLCNVFTIIEGKPTKTEINVIIVDEDLGLGWDETWPQERINNIIENYKKFVWVPLS